MRAKLFKAFAILGYQRQRTSRIFASCLRWQFTHSDSGYCFVLEFYPYADWPTEGTYTLIAEDYQAGEWQVVQATFNQIIAAN